MTRNVTSEERTTKDANISHQSDRRVFLRPLSVICIESTKTRRTQLS
nr:MAG TPA: hypothetical protein [Siphoviridae sp. ctELO16]